MLNWMSAALAALSLGVAAPAMAQEVFVQGGTQGGGIGAALGLAPWIGIHADIDGLNYSRDFNAGGNKFDGELHVRHAGLYADLFPFPAHGFRVTAGALFNRDRLSGTAVPQNGFYKLNGTEIPAALAAGQTASVTAQFPTVMPYIGLGWGHQPQNKGFGFIADVGVAYGKPSVNYSIPSQLQTLDPSDVAAEESSIRHSIQRIKIYPIVQIGISYRF